MRSCGIALGIIGGILSLIASVWVMFLDELSRAYGGSSGRTEEELILINYYISFFAFFLSLTNITSNKLSSALIIIACSVGFLLVNGIVAWCLAISLIGGIFVFIDLIRNKNNPTQCTHNCGTSKEPHIMVTVISSVGIVSGLLGIFVSVTFSPLYGLNFGTNMGLFFLIIILFIINFFWHKFSSSAIVALSSFGYICGNGLLSSFFLISLIASAITFIPWKENNKNKQNQAYNKIHKHANGTENTN